MNSKFAPRCAVCSQSIKPNSGSEETIRIVALDNNFHVECYRCEVSWDVGLSFIAYIYISFNELYRKKNK